VSTTSPVRILGIPGSLRRASYNRAALRAAEELLPADATLEVVDLGGIPPFNEEDERSLPARVAELKAQIRESDAILIATPEYNYSVPGVLKNAIDWGSQPLGSNVWGGKPAAIVGAANSVVGTARAQLHLRQSLVALNMLVYNAELLIGRAPEKFDSAGDLIDPETRAALRDFLAAWMESLRR
jgi:chromate reductase